jgi:protein-L-isoaspartate(D-aspartate) O-methyltransferase
MDMVEQVIVNIERTQYGTRFSTLNSGIVAARRDILCQEFVPKELGPFAYLNISLPVRHEQNTSQPYLIALITLLANVDKNGRVFETGSGYHTAILSRLAEHVFIVELLKLLPNSAARRLERMGYNNIKVQYADGFTAGRNMAHST